MPPLPEVAIPRFTGKAEYATRVLLPNMLYTKVLTSPHPRARIKSLDTSKAEKMPGVAYILTYKNAPRTYPLGEELGFYGEIVSIVAAETEDLAEDAVEAIDVEYEILPSAATIKDVMSPGAPDLLAHVVAEMLGFTTRDRIRVIWGDSDLAPQSGTWAGGHTITCLCHCKWLAVAIKRQGPKISCGLRALAGIEDEAAIRRPVGSVLGLGGFE